MTFSKTQIYSVKYDWLNLNKNRSWPHTVCTGYAKNSRKCSNENVGIPRIAEVSPTNNQSYEKLIKQTGLLRISFSMFTF